MSDRQLLKYAAIAAGHKVPVLDVDWPAGAPIINGRIWNPLTDDGDALRLMVKLVADKRFTHVNLWVKFDLDDGDGVSLVHDVPGNDHTATVESFGKWEGRHRIPGDPFAATRRAIVRAAAEIGKTQSTPGATP